MELGSVNSTNTFAAMLLDSQPADGTVVLAQNQTGGRGQKGSVWLADAGLFLTFSIVLYPRFLFSRQIFLLNKLIACGQNVVAVFGFGKTY